jgi:hypothetical protein
MIGWKGRATDKGCREVGGESQGVKKLHGPPTIKMEPEQGQGTCDTSPDFVIYLST